MMDPTEITRARELPAALDELVRCSTREGHRMMTRLEESWRTGQNRFSRPGEGLFTAQLSGALVGICGIDVDPYAGCPMTGRVRHLYVMPEFRGQGLGRQLVGSVLEHGRTSFHRVRVRAGTRVAEGFYERLGFVRVTEDEATHAITLRSGSAQAGPVARRRERGRP